MAAWCRALWEKWKSGEGQDQSGAPAASGKDDFIESLVQRNAQVAESRESIEAEADSALVEDSMSSFKRPRQPVRL
jgi:hypothetical protein